MINTEKRIFAIQPYKVGSKIGNSLAVVIPSKIVKEQHIDTSTILLARCDSNEKIVLEKIALLNEKMIPADKSFHASTQQVSGEVH
jgi:antitoxin component of MazEF toxin-antitoxin module